MNVMRKMEGELIKKVGFVVGDQIQVGKHYTATCQKVGKNGAIFMFDQYLDKPQVMNQQNTNEGGYEASDLRKFLKGFAMDSMFDEIRELMVPFKKTGDLLRIPTAEEIFGPEEAHKYYETLSFKNQWPLMKDRHNRNTFGRKEQKMKWGWLQNKYKESSSSFAHLSHYGYAGHTGASSVYWVRVVFRLKTF